jgi:hypothetical protein
MSAVTCFHFTQTSSSLHGHPLGLRLLTIQRAYRAKKLLHKLLAIMALSLLLLVPLSMIEGQITSRAARQGEVMHNLAESAAGARPTFSS